MSRLAVVAAPVGRLLRDAFSSYLILIRLMIPALIVVKALDMAGGTHMLAGVLAPVMHLVGLPAETGIVWAAAMLTSIYTGLAVFADMDMQLSIAQVSVLGTMILVAHSLPVEGAVAKATGVSWPATLLIRLGGALSLGALLNLWYSATGTLQEPATMLWRPEVHDPSLAAWALTQLRALGMIFLIILGLMALLRLLKAVGIERLMHAALAPLLRVIGIGREATNVTIIGFTLGISIGAGLLIREARTGKMSARDIFLTMAFLGLCHSVIEDTLLILLMGADLTAILWARLAFAVIVTAALARLGRLIPVAP
ncbi:hypothetical protein [Yanghanlia caeni]|uniref:Nucleoside recognition protein n=1 Tax=Yanghanlia caeni TaxID=3064283 RepID=A0ABU1D8R9_9BURK|nr:hypothetical protein [Alcaligenaceae bacterium LG-2]NGR07889.1 hypothetical protein [bacterium SGD-2]HZH55626.1 hypothetical protein [Burkholderiaceae bacterium]